MLGRRCNDSLEVVAHGVDFSPFPEQQECNHKDKHGQSNEGYSTNYSTSNGSRADCTGLCGAVQSCKERITAIILARQGGYFYRFSLTI